MTDLRALVGGRPTGQPGFVLVAGYVSLNRAAPTHFDDPVWVIIPSHSSEVAYGPMGWPASHGQTMPVQGTPIVIGIDNNGTPTVVSWDGSYS